MAKKKPSSIQEQLEELRDQVAEIREATVDEDGKKSLPPGDLQRGIEDLARLVGKDPSHVWRVSKDVGRAFVPTTIEALARTKLRGEDYEDAKAKAEESRADLENARPGLYQSGQTTQSALGMLAGIAIYAKLAAGGKAQPAPAPAPVKPATKADLVAQYQQRYGAPPPSSVARSKVTLQGALDAKPIVGPRAPMLRSAGRFGLAIGVGMAAGAYLSAAARSASEASAAPRPSPTPTPAPVTTYERTYTTGTKAGQTETVQRKQR